MAFQMGLSEKLRATVEHSGRVVLSDAEVTALVRTKTFHELVITLQFLWASLLVKWARPF